MPTSNSYRLVKWYQGEVAYVSKLLTYEQAEADRAADERWRATERGKIADAVLDAWEFAVVTRDDGDAIPAVAAWLKS